jgi:hypothetical protein
MVESDVTVKVAAISNAGVPLVYTIQLVNGSWVLATDPQAYPRVPKPLPAAFTKALQQGAGGFTMDSQPFWGSWFGESRPGCKTLLCRYQRMKVWASVQEHQQSFGGMEKAY